MTIDGYDIEATFGATLAGGAYNSFGSLLKYPKRASIYSNDFAEVDGIDPDLTNPKFEARKITLNFGIEGANITALMANYEGLYDVLTATGSRTVNAIPGMTHTLRYDNNGSFALSRSLIAPDNHALLTIDMIEDEWTQSAGTATGGAPTGLLTINGTDFGWYGIGSDSGINTVLTAPQLKTAFTDGHTIYTDLIRTKEKKISLALWMLADTQAQFVGNYTAFFHAISAAGLQTLGVPSVGWNLGVYYSDCSSFKVERWSTCKVCARLTVELIAPIFNI